MNNIRVLLDILERRRNQAIFQAEKKKAHLRQQIPELAVIDQEMASAGIRLFEDRIKGKNEAQRDYELSVNKLLDKRAAIYSAHHLTDKDFEPRFQCPLCQDTGFVKGERCRCLNSMISETLFSAFDLTPAAKEICFEHFDLSIYPEEFLGRAKKTRAFGQQYCLHFKEEGNYIFTGKAGRGKTFLCSCIAVELINQGRHVVYITAAHLADLMREYATADRRDETPWLRQALDDCDLLIIDDFGAEYQTDFSNRALFEIINSRLLKKRKLILSTNLDINEIAAQYDVRLSSRLRGNFKQLTFPWGDMRLKK